MMKEEICLADVLQQGKKKKVNLFAIDLSKQIDDLIKFRVPIGIIAFDKVIGGGIPAGKLTEIYGDFSSGKSRIACHILAQTQILGGVTCLIDTERSLDKGLAVLSGLDLSPDKLIYPDPDKILTIESVFEIIKGAVQLLRDSFPDKFLTIVWDSVAATPGMEDLEKEIGRNEASMRRAKVIGDGLRQIMAEVYKHKICLIFINQVRDKIGVMFGEKTETVGGRALKFAASLRIHVKLIGKIKDETTKEQIGNDGEFIVEKSKISRPFGRVHFQMFVDKQIEKYSGLLDYMVRHGKIEALGRGKHKAVVQEGIIEFETIEFPGIYENYFAQN